MNPGRLRHRITFQKQTETQNDYGEVVKEWIDVKTVWASVNPMSAKEFFAAETTNSEITHKIFMRYVRGLRITPDMRIKFKDRQNNINRYFEIIGPPINFEERNKELQLLCKELI